MIGPMGKKNCETSHSGALRADFCGKNDCICSIFIQIEEHKYCILVEVPALRELFPFPVRQNKNTKNVWFRLHGRKNLGGGIFFLMI